MKSVTLTVIANITSNYGESLGNVTSVQKVFKKGKTYATRSRESLKNAIMVEIVADIQTIIDKPKPYQDIKKLPELLQSYLDMYGDLLEEMEGPVYTVISECKARVLEELKDEELTQIFLAKINAKFSALEEKTKECNNVATLQNIKIEADILKVRFLEEIREEYQKILAKREKEQNDTEIITEGGRIILKTLSNPSR